MKKLNNFLATSWLALAIVYVWNYFKPVWEGDDNKLSYKRAFIFCFGYAIYHLAMTGEIKDKVSLTVFYVICALFSLLVGIVTFAQLSEAVKELNNLKQINIDTNKPQ
jgi:hypothetical protein